MWFTAPRPGENWCAGSIVPSRSTPVNSRKPLPTIHETPAFLVFGCFTCMSLRCACECGKTLEIQGFDGADVPGETRLRNRRLQVRLLLGVLRAATTYVVRPVSFPPSVYPLFSYLISASAAPGAERSVDMFQKTLDAINHLRTRDLLAGHGFRSQSDTLAKTTPNGNRANWFSREVDDVSFPAKAHSASRWLSFFASPAPATDAIPPDRTSNA